MSVNKWRRVRIGDEVTLQRGFDLTRKEQRIGKVPVISSSGTNSYHDIALVQAPGVIIGRTGSLGTVFYTKQDYWPHHTTLWVKDFHNNYPKFVYYFFKTLNLLELNVGTASPTLNRNHVHPIKALWPPLPEQKAIASILSSLDDKIKLNQQMNQTLEAMARAIFKSWFVDFDPVRAKMAGNQPVGMDAATANLFPDSFEESALGLIPMGWTVKSIKNICRVNRGASPRPIREYLEGDVPWIKIADATASNGLFIFETKETIKRAGVPKSVPVTPGDLILSNSATCGVPIFVEVEGCIHDGWLLFRNISKISKGYLYHYLKVISDNLVRIANGSVQKNLNTKLVGEQLSIIPPKNIIYAFDKINDSFFNKARSNTIESRTLANIRDTLLPKLMSAGIKSIKV